MTIRILDILKGTTVDGPGFRTAVYFAGCAHRCPGCHNEQSWDFNGGRDETPESLMAVIEEEDFDVTFSGGDPLYQPEGVIALADLIHKAGHSVWLYTGYTWEEIMADPKLREAMAHVDVVVDSPFILEKRDTDLLFRGSSNQRIIDVRKSLATASLHPWTR